MPKIKIVCAHCGSENVMRDAWAEWDIAKQEWVLQNVFDQGFCADCDSEESLDEIEIGEGQDRESYSDDQDRESYSVEDQQ